MPHLIDYYNRMPFTASSSVRYPRRKRCLDRQVSVVRSVSGDSLPWCNRNPVERRVVRLNTTDVPGRDDVDEWFKHRRLPRAPA